MTAVRKNKFMFGFGFFFSERGCEDCSDVFKPCKREGMQREVPGMRQR